MKKIISFLLVLTFAFSFSLAAFAATDTTTTISAGGNTVYAYPGESKELTFTVSSNGGAFSSYVLTLQSQSDKVTIPADGVGTVTYYNGKASYAQASDTTSHSFKVKVNVSADAQPGDTYYVAIGMTECISVDNTEYTNLGSGVGTIIIQKPACDHTPGTWTIVNDSTCSATGLKELRCTKCNELLDSEVIPVKDHTYGNWELTKKPTCTVAGEETRKCTVCGNPETRPVDASGHTPGTEWANDENGHWHVCTVCGEKCDEEGHTFEWVTDKKATEKETGLKHEECKCGWKRNEGTIIPATGELDDVPKTNDITPQITFITVVIAAALGVVTYIFRRKFVK